MVLQPSCYISCHLEKLLIMTEIFFHAVTGNWVIDCYIYISLFRQKDSQTSSLTQENQHTKNTKILK